MICVRSHLTGFFCAPYLKGEGARFKAIAPSFHSDAHSARLDLSGLRESVPELDERAVLGHVGAVGGHAVRGPDAVDAEAAWLAGEAVGDGPAAVRVGRQRRRRLAQPQTQRRPARVVEHLRSSEWRVIALNETGLNDTARGIVYACLTVI